MADFAILIATYDARREFLAQLLRQLAAQATPRVTWDVCGGDEVVGIKRQRLLERAVSPYVAFVDDDDEISPLYCAAILDAIDQRPDAVGFRLRYHMDGVYRGNWAISGQPRGGHTRQITHLSPIRRELALSIGFKPWPVREDIDYQVRLNQRYPNLREVFIDLPLYRYLWRSPQNRIECCTLA